MLADRMRMSSGGLKTFDVQDATVVNQPYSTEGNGGRKLVRLDNGKLYAILVTDDSNATVFESTDNGNTWTLFRELTSGIIIDASLATDGEYVFAIYTRDTRVYFTNVTLGSSRTNVDTGTSSTLNCSVAINDSGTELHAAWSSRTSSYGLSFNIRYAKGTINSDGSVTWGGVTQVTTANHSSEHFYSPSVSVIDGHPLILVEVRGTAWTIAAGRRILAITTKFTNREINNLSVSGWGNRTVYNEPNHSYLQSSPSACVDKDGVIHVAWHGTDATDTLAGNVRYAKSLDGGITWSSMEKLTNGNAAHKNYPTITTSKNQGIFVLFNDSDGRSSTSIVQVGMVYFDGVSWTSKEQLTNLATSNGALSNSPLPSALIDTSLSMDFSKPLFIYRDTTNAKVGFYGTWRAKR